MSTPYTLLSALKDVRLSSGKMLHTQVKRQKPLKLTSEDLKNLGIIEEIIKEPDGGAHRDPKPYSRQSEGFYTSVPSTTLRRCPVSRYSKTDIRNSVTWVFLQNKNMNEIFKLGEDVANMVAAGEVVERPFNVIKELMENSADAGATRISVIVENGGVGMVRVTDNGRGILPEDMSVAVQRFATSKIKTADDVYNVKTFGFRGEALAAISSVSDFSIRSCRKDNDGTEIRIKHGGEPQTLPAPALEGTTVEVKSLFANVPARLKFFKSFSAEEREIAKFVRFFSVINPHIAVELTTNGKNTFNVSADMDMKARAVQVTRERDLVYGEAEYEGMKLNFVTSLPTVQRYRKDMIIIGINGRVVKDASLTQAVVTAYNRMIPDGKFPAAAISLYVDPEKVDVNVHSCEDNRKTSGRTGYFQLCPS